MLASGQLLLRLFEFMQAFVPLGFEPACHQTILWIDGTVPPFGPLRFIAPPFYGHSPLHKGCIVIGFKAFCSAHGRFNTCRVNGMQEGLGGGRVNL